jgi:hypothetical protein
MTTLSQPWRGGMPLNPRTALSDLIARIFSAPFAKVFSSPIASPGAAVAAFLPSSVTGLLCWHDFSIIGNLFQNHTKTTPVTADGDDIGAVVDRSINGRDATQGQIVRRPHYKANIQNGLSMSLTSGDGNSCLVTDSIAHGIGTGDFYAAGVIRIGAVNATWGSIFSNGTMAPSLYTKGGSTQMASYFGATTWNYSKVLSPNTSYLIEWWRSSGVFYIAVNGSTDATTKSLTTSISNAAFYLHNDNSSGPMANYIGESVFYNNYPSASITAMRTYFNSKWVVY